MLFWPIFYETMQWWNKTQGVFYLYKISQVRAPTNINTVRSHTYLLQCHSPEIHQVCTGVNESRILALTYLSPLIFHNSKSKKQRGLQSSYGYHMVPFHWGKQRASNNQKIISGHLIQVRLGAVLGAVLLSHAQLHFPHKELKSNLWSRQSDGLQLRSDRLLLQSIITGCWCDAKTQTPQSQDVKPMVTVCFSLIQHNAAPSFHSPPGCFRANEFSSPYSLLASSKNPKWFWQLDSHASSTCFMFEPCSKAGA